MFFVIGSVYCAQLGAGQGDRRDRGWVGGHKWVSESSPAFWALISCLLEFPAFLISYWKPRHGQQLGCWEMNGKFPTDLVMKDQVEIWKNKFII